MLRLEDVDVPEPMGSAALVEIRSSALNHLDIWLRRGMPSVPKPRTLGADGAGVVAALGADAEGVELGQNVLINPGLFCRRCRFCLAGEHSLCLRFKVLGEHVDGTNADYVLVPARNLHPIPDGMDVRRGRRVRARVRDGMAHARHQGPAPPRRVGADLGRRRRRRERGARDLPCRRCAGDRDLVERREAASEPLAMGAHSIVNHERDDVADAVRSLTDGRGVDIVVEHVGAATWARSIDALARGGRLVTCGASSGGQPAAGLHRIFWKQVSVHGSTMGSDSEFRAVLELGAAGRIRPHVDAVFPMDRVGDAHRRLEAGEQFGKVVLRISA